jgi:DNA-binding transcriptional LysR family regulator
LDTRFLETFLLVVDQGSIASAARNLNIAPAAVAQRIHALENELGYKLIMRSGRTVSMTESGAAIVDKVRKFVRQVRELHTPPGDSPLTGGLRLGAIATVMTGFLPEIIAKISDTYVGMEFYVQPGSSSALYEQVANGTLDAAIVAQPPFELPKSCEWRTLYRENLVLLKSVNVEGNEIARIIETNPFIRYDERSWGGLLVENYLRTLQIKPRVRFELDALEAIAVLVDRGLGVSLVPNWPQPWPEGLRLDKIPIGDPAFDRHIGMLWNRATPCLRLIMAILQEVSSKRTSP